jgi:hypothetical protein
MSLKMTLEIIGIVGGALTFAAGLRSALKNRLPVSPLRGAPLCGGLVLMLGSLLLLVAGLPHPKPSGTVIAIDRAGQTISLAWCQVRPKQVDLQEVNRYRIARPALLDGLQLGQVYVVAKADQELSSSVIGRC